MPTEIADGHPVVCVFGSYSPKPGSALWEQAYSIGYALARAGYVVANGGYDGTMHASAKGAKDAGGRTIGVTCSVFSNYRGKVLKANPCIDREICHDDLLRRIEAMMHMGTAYVILEGGTGTLSEFGIVWEYVCKELIPPRPIFVVGDFWIPVVETIGRVRPQHCECIHKVATAEQIVAILGPASPPVGR
ncbi:MAG TPA: LOG family protein [Phycisphaerae bacterium]|nr:LOG family protein [Phycisphaerae bacterium]HOJ75659.1 LOG family protein [Phycisphaerae bacterium]HOM52527.1 LOG family protein [Phycisphaerae bacterium]HON69363.1 LOG family protein [Phycisphaerae bacterium]HOQ86826.1 LOG family protein [Phycisphaerae bacterium]